MHVPQHPSTAGSGDLQGTSGAGPATAQRALFGCTAPAAAPSTAAAGGALPGHAAARQSEAGTDSSCAELACAAQPMLPCTNSASAVPLPPPAAMAVLQTGAPSGATASQDTAAAPSFLADKPIPTQPSHGGKGEQPAEQRVSEPGPTPAAGMLLQHLRAGEAAAAGTATKVQPAAKRMQGLGAPVRLLACSRSETTELPQRTVLRSKHNPFQDADVFLGLPVPCQMYVQPLVLHCLQFPRG